jgi:hypothetical protein
MGFDLTPGGLTALALQGMTHYVSPMNQQKIRLYGQSPLPAWVNKLQLENTFARHTPLELNSNYETDPGFHRVEWKTQMLPFGPERFSLHISSPELAILETLMDVPIAVSFEHANNLIQGLPTLSPQKVARLMEQCKNVKVKRLFLWLAGRNHSPWLKRLDLERFTFKAGTLGSGKRVIAKGGKLDRNYLITVPAEMVRETLG